MREYSVKGFFYGFGTSKAWKNVSKSILQLPTATTNGVEALNQHYEALVLVYSELSASLRKSPKHEYRSLNIAKDALKRLFSVFCRVIDSNKERHLQTSTTNVVETLKNLYKALELVKSVLSASSGKKTLKYARI